MHACAPTSPVTLLTAPGDAITDGAVSIGGVDHHIIRDLGNLDPFLMTVVSASDVWLFLGSHGGVTAGRRNPDHALFPYCTEDKLTDTAGVTGATTLIRSSSGDVWEPLSSTDRHAPSRWLGRAVLGDEVTWGESSGALGLEFRVSWRCSPGFGVVRECVLTNTAAQDITLQVLDGFRNLLPAGVTQRTQNDLSVLLDAYKRSEIEPDTGLGVHFLSSLLTDVAEPAEALSATTVWRLGPEPCVHLASERQIESFRTGAEVVDERSSRGVRAAHLAVWTTTLSPGSSITWSTIADTELNTAQVHDLNGLLQDRDAARGAVEGDLAFARSSLAALLQAADANQTTGDKGASAHHLASVLYNGMRGGIPRQGYSVKREDVRRHVQLHNSLLAEKHARRIDELPDTLSTGELTRLWSESGDPGLERLAMTFLPLSFSRRHGDPSRPWNRFNIVLEDALGQPVTGFQGNWRDIFQNWEATALSYPELTENMVAIFLNATTVDGYNPYRVTHEGIDWEVPEPDNPWANIGYWGDHQIVYLLRLLELSQDFHPGKMATRLDSPIFTTADVPYRLGSFDEIWDNPSATITFDVDVDGRARERAAVIGGDGLLKHGPSGELHLTTLADKLLTLGAAKMVNFVPGAGIWMNTQRPEWNDANNALVGHGASVVTMAHLVRYFEHMARLMSGEDVRLRPELVELIHQLTAILDGASAAAETDGAQRYLVVSALGRAGAAYRASCYPDHDAGRTTLKGDELSRFLTISLGWLRGGVRASRRDDGLFHGYNTLGFSPGSIVVRRLPLMLEGQVAVLSAGVLTARESLDLVAALQSSPLYRPDQHSYMLYPNRDLPGFLERNTIDPTLLDQCRGIDVLFADATQDVLVRDATGGVHFAPGLRNVAVLEKRLNDALMGERGVDCDALALAYEATFDHASFTGRSGSFFAYEGLGSIYWHMVSKLALAVLDAHHCALRDDEDPMVVAGLARAHRDIRSGLGFAKTAQEFGAFPADPYSHTPGHTGARQPGMTGQAKEDVIMRFHELGVRVHDGVLHLDPGCVDAQEWLTGPATMVAAQQDGTPRSVTLEQGELGFTVCGVPVIYRRDGRGLTVTLRDGSRVAMDSGLDRDTTARILARDGYVQQIVAGLISEGATLREVPHVESDAMADQPYTAGRNGWSEVT